MTDYRYHLCRAFPLQGEGPIFAFFGINPSTADADTDDATVRKWNGFVSRWGGSEYIVGNCFAARSTDVKGLSSMDDPIGPRNDTFIKVICEQADILVPCWGSRNKIPERLRSRIDDVLSILKESNKPIKTFGLTKDGDPKHPLMLSYETQLVDFHDA